MGVRAEQQQKKQSVYDNIVYYILNINNKVNLLDLYLIYNDNTFKNRNMFISYIKNKVKHDPKVHVKSFGRNGTMIAPANILL